MTAPARPLPDWIWDYFERLGYRVEVGADGKVERILRPDGTVAMTVQKAPPPP
jgi:hypothetical protein